MKKAVIFAPFWRQSGHVGNYRIDRFMRWLAAEGYCVVLVRAGSVTGQRQESWGVEVTIRDPMGLYRDAAVDDVAIKARKPNKIRRMLARQQQEVLYLSKLELRRQQVVWLLICCR